MYVFDKQVVRTNNHELESLSSTHKDKVYFVVNHLSLHLSLMKK